ncbi:CatB-related O-acetyltransferase [Phocaeicola sp.]
MFRGIKNIIRFFWHLYRANVFPGCLFSYESKCRISIKANIIGFRILNYVSIDDYTYIAQNSNISYTNIGKYCSIGPNFLCGWGIHPTDGISTSPMFYSTMEQNGTSVCKKTKIEERKFINIGNDVFIGANVTVLDGVTIGDGAVIGAGAIVSKDIPPYAVAVGCPIRVIKYRFSPEKVDALLKMKWWEYGEKYHLSIERNFFDIDGFLKKYSK